MKQAARDIVSVGKVVKKAAFLQTVLAVARGRSSVRSNALHLTKDRHTIPRGIAAATQGLFDTKKSHGPKEH